MGTGLRAGVIASVLACVGQTADAQQEQSFRAELQGPAQGPRNVFLTDEQSIQRLKEQLSDPQQRFALRAEHRAAIEAGHPDLAAALGIDTATEQKLFDLLVDQQMQRLAELPDRSRLRPSAGSNPLQAIADAQTKMIEAQRELLGAEAAERYRNYVETLGARLEVGRLDARLTGGDRLGAEQKARLVPLLHEAQYAAYKDLLFGAPRSARLEAGATNSAPGRIHTALADSADRTEDMLRRTLEADRELLARVAGFLTAPQLTALGAMRAENVGRLRQRIEQMRVQAGINSANSAALDVRPAEERVRKPLLGNLKVEISVAVDTGKPMLVKHTGPNGHAVELEVDGLVVEVTPTLYEGNYLEARLAYYEQTSAGRRLIGSGSQGGMAGGSVGSFSGGGGSTVVMGARKAYAVHTNVAAAAL